MALLDDFVTVVSVAAENHGIVTRSLLLEAGVGETSIGRLARQGGAMHAQGPGVYLVPAMMDEQLSEYRVALQRLDPTAGQSGFWQDPLHADRGVLSHLAAAYVWGAVDLPREIHVTVPRQRRLGGLQAHTATLQPEEVTVHRGVPVTTVERTTRDLAVWPMDDDHRARWLEHCLDEGLLTADGAAELLGERAEATMQFVEA